MLDIQKIRVLCFDVDGTLSDTDDYYADKFIGLVSAVAALHGARSGTSRAVDS